MANLKNAGIDDHKSMRSANSKKSMFKDEEVENYIVVPPDGGWGWVIVVAAFLNNMIADGITFTFGIFLEELSSAFNVTIGTVTVIGSVMNFFYYLSGPFVSALVNRYGFRCVSILGSLMGAIGFLAGSYSTNYLLFCFFVGALIGLGCGMVTIPAIIVVGFYFERWRALATGMATCGSGIGTLLTPIVVNYLLTYFDWRGTFRILSCICAAPSILALLYRPLVPVKVVQDEKEIKIIQQSESIGTFSAEGNESCCKTCNFNCIHHNRYYPTTAHFVTIDTVVLERPDIDDDNSSYSHNTHTIPIVTNYTSSVNQVVLVDSRNLPARKRKCKRCCFSCLRILCCSRCETVSRPMYRDDIFFGHSLSLLPQYKESLANQQHARKLRMNQTQTSRGILRPPSTAYHMSVTRVTTHREIYSKSNEDSCSCHLAIVRTLSTMLDLRLMKSPAFQMFAWNGMFIVFGYMVPYLYIKDRAIEGNISVNDAFWLLSAIGAANTVGRILSGILPSVTNLRVIEYSCFCITLAGLTTVLSGLSMRVEYQFGYACIYGIAGSCIATLRPIIVVELFGLENLTNAYGLQMMYMAVAVFSGTMIAGILYDYTNDFNVCFYMAGGCLMFSAFMLAFIRKIRAYEIKHCKIDLK